MINRIGIFVKELNKTFNKIKNILLGIRRSMVKLKSRSYTDELRILRIRNRSDKVIQSEVETKTWKI